jgi:tetratricopeptide (TPR) repeat protein
MFTRLSALPATLLIVVFLGGGTPLSAQSSDGEAVKRVVSEETESYYRHDADAWKSKWVQDSTAIRTLVNSGAYSLAVGWDKFGPATLDAIRKDPTPERIRFANSNFAVRTDGALAWAEYDQRIDFANDSLPYVSREQRTLVKRNGEWKILSAGTFDVSTYGTLPRWTEYRINRTAADLIAAKNHRDAITVLKMNAQLFPQSPRVYYLLGEAYASANDTKLAAENYEKSLAIDPKFEPSRAAMTKLRGTNSP